MSNLAKQAQLGNTDTFIITVTNNCLIWLKAYSARGKPCIFCKPNQLPRTSQVLDLRGEATTAAFLSQHDCQLRSTCSSLHPQISVVLNLHQRVDFLQEMEIITERHNWSQGRRQPTVWCLGTTDATTTQPQHLLEATVMKVSKWFHRPCKKVTQMHYGSSLLPSKCPWATA